MEVALKHALQKVFRRVNKNFIFENDTGGEHWEMPPPGYDANKILRDDCDGFCLACRILLRRDQIPNRLVYCEVEGERHLVVEVEGWILDNLQQRVVSNKVLRHYRWLRISGYAAGEPWREIVSPVNC
ncbi:MAG: transglutaminase-like cysteine peptidase [Proteobacteria bacterium]|nr:transglutaminase-like cysteine peptidase [Pseudomonadota bacterium]